MMNIMSAGNNDIATRLNDCLFFHNDISRYSKKLELSLNLSLKRNMKGINMKNGEF